ncbi:hypothetical protein M758_12G155900 [Ceratodon purpureus]|nr:hypothetical protein M758_12G155900 [Ceratodon purpureus]
MSSPNWADISPSWYDPSSRLPIRLTHRHPFSEGFSWHPEGGEGSRAGYSAEMAGGEVSVHSNKAKDVATASAEASFCGNQCGHIHSSGALCLVRVGKLVTYKDHQKSDMNSLFHNLCVHRIHYPSGSHYPSRSQANDVDSESRIGAVGLSRIAMLNFSPR